MIQVDLIKKGREGGREADKICLKGGRKEDTICLNFNLFVQLKNLTIWTPDTLNQSLQFISIYQLAKNVNDKILFILHCS